MRPVDLNASLSICGHGGSMGNFPLLLRATLVFAGNFQEPWQATMASLHSAAAVDSTVMDVGGRHVL